MKELRKETYRTSHPSRITFGDPYYFESFTGDKLRSLTLDLKVPDWMEVRLVLREDLMEREDYRVSVLEPKYGKDWNEYLQRRHGRARQPPQLA